MGQEDPAVFAAIGTTPELFVHFAHLPPPPATPEPWLPLTTAAQHLGCTTRQMRRLYRRYGVRAQRRGHRKLLAYSSILNLGVIVETRSSYV